MTMYKIQKQVESKFNLVRLLNTILNTNEKYKIKDLVKVIVGQENVF